MKLPQFTISDLLLSMTLIAVGVVAITQSVHFGQSPEPWTDVAIWTCGGAAVGAGIYTPFQHRLLGACVGAVIQLIIAASMFALGSGARVHF